MKGNITFFGRLWLSCWFLSIWVQPLRLQLFLTGLLSFVITVAFSYVEIEEKKKEEKRAIKQAFEDESYIDSL